MNQIGTYTIVGGKERETIKFLNLKFKLTLTTLIVLHYTACHLMVTTNS